MLGKFPETTPILSVFCYIFESQVASEEANYLGQTTAVKLKLFFQVPKQKYDFIVVDVDLTGSDYLGQDGIYGAYDLGSSALNLSKLEPKFDTITGEISLQK